MNLIVKIMKDRGGEMLKIVQMHDFIAVSNEKVKSGEWEIGESYFLACFFTCCNALIFLSL